MAIERKSVATMSKELLFRRVTILNWLPKYSRMDAISDAIAGFTVGLTMVPQSIAYAALAGLTAQYGLYSAFMGGFVYAAFGTIKEVSIGPTSLMALMAIEYTQELPVEFVILLAFLAGCVEFLMGVLNLGFLVDFISAPVRSGFTSATALIVSVSQLKGLIGLRFKSHGLPDNIYHIATQAGEIRLWDSILGLACVIFLLGFRLLKDIPIGPKDPTKQTPTHRAIKKTLWFISISRNALAVLLSTIAAYAFVSFGPSPFILSGKVQSGLPPFGLPPFSAQVGNTTYTFVEMCSELGSAIVLVPLVAVLANVAIAKAFASGTTLDATQEMLTLGMCNILGSCFQSMPTCGAFTRSAVSNASGARTPLVGIYSGTIILLALSFLTPYFYFIPRATLSAVLICAVIFMVEWEVVLPMWRSSMNEKNPEMAIERKSVATMSKELLFRRVTILNWLPKYSRMDAISDAIAGFTVGLTMVPQSIAYAALAGLTAQYGLYSAFMGGFVYAAFGTIKEVSIGPTSLMALMAIEYTQELPVEFVILLAFLAGCVEFLMGVLNLGFLVDFISAPVRSGFTSATALIVSVSQLKGLIGLRFKSHGLPDNIYHIATQAGEIRLWDSILGLACVIFLLGFRLLKDIPIGPKDPTKQTPTHRAIKKTLWFISISRNALAVLLSTIAAYAFVSFGPSPFILSGKVQSGLPPFGLPPFSAQVGNTTYTFVEMCSELGSAIVLVPLVAVLANVAIAKAFASGTTLDATQEMLTLGMCNILGSCFQSMPTCGAFTRSAVSNASGARTPLVGIYSGTIILLALSFLTPYFYFIPRATLSAVLICAVIFMVEWEVVLPMWRSSKADFFLLVATFATCLWFGVEMGLLLGIVVNISFLLYLWARPHFAIELRKSLIETEYVLVSADVGLFYPAANFLHTEMTKAAINVGHGTLPVVLDCNNFRGIDCTIAMGVDMLVKDFAKRKQSIILYNLRDEIIYILHGMDVNFQYCNSQEELLDLLIGEKIDLGRSETLPLIDGKPLVERMQLETEVTPKVNRSLLRSVLFNSRGDLEKTGCNYMDELRRKGSFAE